MEFLYSLEESPVGMLISSTIWGYPIALSLHALGMGVMVGISLMYCLRVIGFAPRIPVFSLAPHWRIALAGFAVNLVSGTLLFLGSASSLAVNVPFRIKLVMVILGLLLTWRLYSICINGDGTVTPSHRVLASVALVVWIVALIAGRRIGYVF